MCVCVYEDKLVFADEESPDAWDMQVHCSVCVRVETTPYICIYIYVYMHVYVCIYIFLFCFKYICECIYEYVQIYRYIESKPPFDKNESAFDEGASPDAWDMQVHVTLTADPKSSQLTLNPQK